MGVSLRRASKLAAGNLILFAVLSAIALAGVELVLRMRYPRNPTPTLVSDPVLGWDALPAVEPVGAEDSPWTIAFIGDSFTDSKRWPELTIRWLDERDIAVSGHSMGAAGHGTIQTHLKLERHIDTVRPDAIVFLLFAWNDIRDNDQYPRTVYNASTRRRPYFDLDRSPPRLIPLAPASLWDRLLEASELYDKLLLPSLLARHGRVMDRDVDAFHQASDPAMVHYADPASWLPYYRPSMQDSRYVTRSYAATERALGMLGSLSRERGVPLLCIGIDNAFTVDSDVRDEWIPEDSGVDLDLPLRRLASIAEDLSIPFVDAAPRLRALSVELGGRKLYNGPPGNLSAHFDSEAEGLVASIAGEWIRQSLVDGATPETTDSPRRPESADRP